MESGMNATSRWGITGTEELGNGMAVSFKLENGFNSDSGTPGNGSRLFGCESSLTLSGSFGQFSMGCMGGVASSAGTYDIIYLNAYAFDGFDNSICVMMISDRCDDTITYQTPAFAGVKVTAQYSFKGDGKDGQGAEGKSSADRYASLAAEGHRGPLGFQ